MGYGVQPLGGEKHGAPVADVPPHGYAVIKLQRIERGMEAVPPDDQYAESAFELCHIPAALIM